MIRTIPAPETGRPRRRSTTWGRTVVDYPARPDDTHPETLEWIARITDMRLEDVPPGCPTCGSTVVSSQVRTCARCHQTYPLAAFQRHRSKPLGRDYLCKPCAAQAWPARNRRRKQRQFRAILGRTG
jgi:hypothetical protein